MDQEDDKFCRDFRPLTPDDKPDGYGSFFKKLFKKIRPGDSQNPSLEVDTEVICEENMNEVFDQDETIHLPEENVLERSLPNVRKRIKSLLEWGQANQLNSKSVSFKRNWLPDSASKQCHECQEKFTTFRRKHHCRICGQIFCSKCCNCVIEAKYFNTTGDLRSCTYCYKVLLSVLQSDSSSETSGHTYKKMLADIRGYPAERSSLLDKTDIPATNGTPGPVFKTVRGFMEANFLTSTRAADTDLSYRLDESQRQDMSSEMLKLLKDANQLETLYSNLFFDTQRLILQSNKYKLQTYPDTFLAPQLIQWLIDNDRAANRPSAVAIGQALLDAGFIVCVWRSDTHFQDDNNIYRPVHDRAVGGKTETVQEAKGCELASGEPLWAKQIPLQPQSLQTSFDPMSNVEISDHISASSSSYCLDLNVDDNTVSLKRPRRDSDTADGRNFTEVSAALTSRVRLPSARENYDGLMSEEVLQAMETPQPFIVDTKEFDSSSAEGGSSVARSMNLVMENNMSVIWERHEQKLLTQLITQANISNLWFRIIQSTARTVADLIQPDIKHDSDDMDIRRYIHFKKMSGAGDMPRQCQVVNGTVCSKNVLYRSMKSKLTDPSILLIGSGIELQQRGDQMKMVSLETIFCQENNYLRNVVAKIVRYKPDIVLVEKNVSHQASQLLQEAGITVILNVKISVMERVARCTQGQIVKSIDAQVAPPVLGMCHSFYLGTYTTWDHRQKTLMYFDGCPMHASCALILKGPHHEELKKVKQIIYFMIFAAYNFKLERSFLRDELAFTSPTFLHEIDMDMATQTANEDSDVVVQDQSTSTDQDPLQLPVDLMKLYGGVADKNRFCQELDSVLLSVSPYYKFTVPYLMSDSGLASPVAKFIPKKLYFSQRFEQKNVILENRPKYPPARSNVVRGPVHNLASQPMVAPASSLEIQTLLCDYRARGGTIDLVCDCCKKDQQSPKPVKSEEKETKTSYNSNALTQQGEIDSLDPMNHQRLPVMFCSYSMSHPASKFCVGPDTVIMNFYGDNDICLGAFLEDYCFNKDYECPSQCSQEALSHIRRFAHGNSCIEVLLQEVKSSFSTSSGILFWNWCRLCNKMSPVVQLSSESWSFSLAKYLEMRLYESHMNRIGFNACKHSIHQDQYHYFSTGTLIAVFKYVEVSTRELLIPPSRISYVPDPTIYSDTLKRVNKLSSYGYDVFNAILAQITRITDDSTQKSENLLKSMLAQESQQRLGFKESIEVIQKQLASPELTPSLHKDLDDLGKEQAMTIMFGILDQICLISVLLTRIANDWNYKFQDIANCKKKDDKLARAANTNPHSRHASATTFGGLPLLVVPADGQANSNQDAQIDEELTEPNILLSESGEPAKRITEPYSHSEAVSQPPSPTPERKPNAVRQIISSLRNQNTDSQIKIPFPLNQHYGVLKEFKIPVIVYEEQPSSIIAHALASESYRQELSEMQRNQSRQDPTVESSKNSHIELHFDDQSTNFYCKIFYATQFRKLRSMVFPKGEECYIRCLSNCIKWDAKGGKSGSAFCKTLDDRFVLKQMSQPEEDSFVKFGPLYIQYITTCKEQNVPTSLTKIVGVYYIIWKNTVTGKEKKLTLLVMENLFYQRTITHKFDLKGSLRNRLVNTTGKEEAEVVLLDENLQKMLYSSPLYLRSHCKEILSRSIELDSIFLANHLVMDYSLLVGIDEDKNEIIVGIIDYLRTFTWDKKLETMFKSTVLSSVVGEKPTVVSPRVYRTRFCAAMDRYFVLLPDRWFALGSTPRARNL